METKCYCISYVAIRISTPPINATSSFNISRVYQQESFADVRDYGLLAPHRGLHYNGLDNISSRCNQSFLET